MLGYERRQQDHYPPIAYPHASFSHYTKPPTPPPEMHGDFRTNNSYHDRSRQLSAYASDAQAQSITLPPVRQSLQEHGREVAYTQPPSPRSFASNGSSSVAYTNGRSTIEGSSNNDTNNTRRSSNAQNNSSSDTSAFTSSLTTNDHSDETNPSHQSAHANAIAPSFQIPKTVNDSGGSLSELAAEITCLFWFESTELLQQIEQTQLAIMPARSLVKDAVPTSGFRKWVTTILSTTLVGANVVLLALLFIHRLKNLNPAVRGKPGSEYRLLTVALMLGNKFLDDNTYTNKTWAEVSGINVSEVHIMEVEFLSNMKYCLYTSLEQWNDWQVLLNRYAAYVDRAMNPVPVRATVPAPILPPASSVRLPIALPSPPASIQASPPYNAERNGVVYAATSGGSHGITPAPSPLAPYPSVSHEPASRKRSRDDSNVEPPSKRLSGIIPRSSELPAGYRSAIPTLPPPVIQTTQVTPTALSSQPHTLPPMSVPPTRAMGLVYPSTTSQSSTPTYRSMTADVRSNMFPAQQQQSQTSSRQQSPFWQSGDDIRRPELPPTSNILHASENSPNAYLQQRSSPYRPVHNVSTLLYPPPSTTLQSRPQNLEYSHMHYQPLGKSSQVQSGRLPVMTPMNWLEGLVPLRPCNLPATASTRHPLSFQQT